LKIIRPITVRYASWVYPLGIEEPFLRQLVEDATNRKVEIVEDFNKKVDVQFEGVYCDRKIPKFGTRMHRFIHSNLPGGIKFKGGKHTPNQQPTGRAKVNIFFTGENERPPEGSWDAYLTFDLNSYGDRNAYLPLWWITSSDILFPTVSPYLGREISLDYLMSNRESNYDSRKKFCVAFIGKAYPFRMHALTALSKIGDVDVFGGIARNTKQTTAKEKFEISQKYKFVFAFENDFFPGYVTEKAPEAYATGAIPLYWGSDPKGYINQKSVLNLANYPTLEEFTTQVGVVNNDKEIWSSIANQPFLSKRPNLDEVRALMSRVLEPLKAELK
jgi:hypothetical protein